MKKKIKAFAVVDKEGKASSAWVFKVGAQTHSFSGTKVIPCTITYEI